MSDDPSVPGDVGAMADELGKNDKVPQATELVRLAETNYRFAIADDGRCFAVELNGPNLARPLRGTDGLRQELSKAYYRDHKRAPSSSALADALTVIEGIAADADREPLALRVARHGAGIVLDLGGADGAVVFVDSTGWRIIERSPVVFRRTELTKALPTPERGGVVTELEQVLNVHDASWPLLVGWLVATFIPEIPHPMLLLTGEQGTGKSTAADLIGTTIDPSAAPLQAPPSDVPGWVMTAQGAWVVAVDNLSGVPAWLSDALCRAVTGDGLVKRTLYSDSSLTVVTFRRCIVLTAIDAGALRGDLAERLLTVELERIDPTERRADAELRAAFTRAHPRVLGALLDLVAQVLARLDNVQVNELPRMADFARVLAAVDEVRGTDSLSTYLSIGDRLAADVVAADQVATAVVELMTERDNWTGQASTLLELLTERTFGDRHPGRDWPKTAHGLSGRLRKTATVLRPLGVDVVFHPRSGTQRPIELTKTERVGETASQASQASHMAADQGLFDDAPRDARDARDAQRHSQATRASQREMDPDQGLCGTDDARDARDALFASLSLLESHAGGATAPLTMSASVSTAPAAERCSDDTNHTTPHERFRP